MLASHAGKWGCCFSYPGQSPWATQMFLLRSKMTSNNCFPEYPSAKVLSDNHCFTRKDTHRRKMTSGSVSLIPQLSRWPIWTLSKCKKYAILEKKIRSHWLIRMGELWVSEVGGCLPSVSLDRSHPEKRPSVPWRCTHQPSSASLGNGLFQTREFCGARQVLFSKYSDCPSLLSL